MAIVGTPMPGFPSLQNLWGRMVDRLDYLIGFQGVNPEWRLQNYRITDSVEGETIEFFSFPV